MKINIPWIFITNHKSYHLIFCRRSAHPDSTRAHAFTSRIPNRRALHSFNLSCETNCPNCATKHGQLLNTSRQYHWNVAVVGFWRNSLNARNGKRRRVVVNRLQSTKGNQSERRPLASWHTAPSGLPVDSNWALATPAQYSSHNTDTPPPTHPIFRPLAEPSLWFDLGCRYKY